MWKCYQCRKGGCGTSTTSSISRVSTKTDNYVATVWTPRRGFQSSSQAQQAQGQGQVGGRSTAVKDLHTNFIDFLKKNVKPAQRKDKQGLLHNLLSIIHEEPTIPTTPSISIPTSSTTAAASTMSPLPHGDTTKSHGWIYRNSMTMPKASKKAIYKDKEVTVHKEEYTLLDHSPLPETVIDEPFSRKIPRLAHGLDRVLHSPGIHPLKDFYTNKYNFSTALENIHPPEVIDTNIFPPFIPAYQDETLLSLAHSHQCKIIGSTSSVGPFLSQLYFLISTFKPVNLLGLSNSIQMQSVHFTKLTLRPVFMSIIPKGGVYCIKKEQEATQPNAILLDLGKTLEKMLTLEKHEFDSLVKPSTSPPFEPESFHYLKVGNCLLRAQIDCCDPNIPGEHKSFDLKTRAIAPIRYDLAHYTQRQDRRLITLTGTDLSFEREFYDMVRTSFLRYNYQARIGRMDGIFVAYHNTRQMLGFEYLSRKEMDKFVFGNSAFGDKCFAAILKLFQHLIQHLTDLYPDQHLKMLVRAQGNQELQFFVERPRASATSNMLPSPTQRNPISGIVELFQVKLSIMLNGERVLHLLQLEEEDNISIGVNISKRTDLSQSSIDTDYVDLLRASGSL